MNDYDDCQQHSDDAGLHNRMPMGGPADDGDDDDDDAVYPSDAVYRQPGPP